MRYTTIDNQLNQLMEIPRINKVIFSYLILSRTFSHYTWDYITCYDQGLTAVEYKVQ